MKPWYRSKTIRVNALMAGLVALEANTNMLQPYLPGNFYAIMAVALPVINTVLRVITKVPVSVGKGNQS